MRSTAPDIHEQAREWNRAKRRASRASLMFNGAVAVVIAVSVIAAGWHAAWWAAGGVILGEAVRDARHARRVLRWLKAREAERDEREVHQRNGTAAS